MEREIIEHGGREMRNSVFFGREPLLGFIPPFMVWNLVIVVLVGLIFYWLLKSSQRSSDTPLDVLKKRYVSGEIDREAFEQMKKDISD